MNVQDFATHLQAEGANILGFADISALRDDGVKIFPYGISLGVALDPQMIAEIHQGPTAQYYAEYERVNSLLGRLGQSCVQACPGGALTGVDW